MMADFNVYISLNNNVFVNGLESTGARLSTYAVMAKFGNIPLLHGCIVPSHNNKKISHSAPFYNRYVHISLTK